MKKPKMLAAIAAGESRRKWQGAGSKGDPERRLIERADVIEKHELRDHVVFSADIAAALRRARCIAIA